MTHGWQRDAGKLGDRWLIDEKQTPGSQEIDEGQINGRQLQEIQIIDDRQITEIQGSQMISDTWMVENTGQLDDS